MMPNTSSFAVSRATHQAWQSDERTNVNPDLRERRVRPKYELQPDPIGLALAKLHPGEAVQAVAAWIEGHLPRRRAADTEAAAVGASSADIDPLRAEV